MSASRAPLVQIFWPLITYSSPSRRAEVRSEARSEPDPGSLYPWHQISSPRIVGRISSCFWSSRPKCSSVGTNMLMPWFSIPREIPALWNSSSITRLARASGSWPAPP